MRNFPAVLALAGRAGAGKSTLAAELVAQHGYTLLKFAAPLKSMLAALGLSEEEIEGARKESPSALLGGATPRYAMQTLGTEWGRSLINADLWVHAWRRQAEQILADGGRVVVDDCRFFNELDAVLQLGGVAVRLLRPGPVIVGAHQSERELAAVDLPEIVNDAPPAIVAERLSRFLYREVGHATDL